MDRPTPKHPVEPHPVPIKCAAVLAAVKDKPSVAAEGAAILDCRSTRTALDVCGRDEGRGGSTWGRTKEDDQESEEKKSGWRLHFPLPVPTACRVSGSGSR